MHELHPSDQALVDQGIVPTYPRGLEGGEFEVAARGLRRTTPTGQRSAVSGTPITTEGEVVREMLLLNELRAKSQREGS